MANTVFGRPASGGHFCHPLARDYLSGACSSTRDRVKERWPRLRPQSGTASVEIASVGLFAKQGDAALLVDQLARGALAFCRVGFVVAADQLDLPPEHAAARIDIVDRNGEAAGNPFA